MKKLGQTVNHLYTKFLAFTKKKTIFYTHSSEKGKMKQPMSQLFQVFRIRKTSGTNKTSDYSPI